MARAREGVQTVLSGSLHDFSIEHVLRLLELSRQGGVLTVRHGGRRTVIDVSGGAVAVRGEDLELALGGILDDRDGTFTFKPGPIGLRHVLTPVDDCLARARAAVTALEPIRKDIPTDDMRFTLSERATSGGQFTLRGEELRVLVAIDGRRRVSDIAAQQKGSLVATLKILHRLLTQGLIEVAGSSALVAVETVGAAPGTSRPQPVIAESEAVPADEDNLAQALDARLAALADAELLEIGPPTGAVEAPAVAAEKATSEPQDDLVIVRPSAAVVDAAGSRTVRFELHYLPASVEPPPLDIESPARPAPRRPGLFGFLGIFRRPGAGAAPEIIDVPSAGQLGALANELLGEYSRRAEANTARASTAGRDAFREPLAERMQRIYATRPLGKRLPLREGLIDVGVLHQADHPPAQVLPYLALLVRDLRDEAERLWGPKEALATYRAIAERVFGGERLATPTQILERAAEPPRARLIIRMGGTGTFELGPRTYVIGRSVSCDVHLADASVSSQHAKLVPDLDVFRVVDLGSLNGTFVNGERIDGERVLENGDVLRLGDAIVAYEVVTAKVGA